MKRNQTLFEAIAARHGVPMGLIHWSHARGVETIEVAFHHPDGKVEAFDLKGFA